VGKRSRLEWNLIRRGHREQRPHLRPIDGIAFERATQAGVDRKACGESERRRLGQSRLGKKVAQAGVILVNRGERVLNVPQSRGENKSNDAALLVTEKRSYRVVGVAVEPVDQSNDLGEVGALHMVRGFDGESLKGRRVR